MNAMPSPRARRVRDAEPVRAPLERALADAMPVILGGLGVIGAACTLVDLVSLPPGARWIVAYDAVITTSFFGARAVWKASAIVRRFMYPLGMTFGLMLASNILAAMLLTRQMAYSAHLALTIVCAGAFFSSVPWLVAYDLAVIAAWWIVARRMGTASELWTHGLGFAVAVGLSAILLLTRLRAYGQMALLRMRDRVRRERLRAALASARTEIAQRERAEVEEKHLKEQLLQALKMDALGRLAGGVAHEVNNALAAIATVTGLMLEEDSLDRVAREDLNSILEASARAAELTRNLLAVGRKGKYTAEILDPGHLVATARASIEDKLAPSIDVEIVLAHEEARIEGDSAQLVQALRSLIANAADAMPDGGMLSIQTACVTLSGADAHARAVAPGRYVAFTVQDSGAGMDSETRKAAFDPFFTTKPFGEGAGLGLPMVYGAARNHGGNAEIVSARGRGTAVTLHVPCAGQLPAERESVAPTSGPRRDLGACSVLVVDDEPAVRGAARRILERMGLRVREAENGRRALEVHGSDGPFDLVVCDMVMPTMGGKEFVTRLRERSPASRVLLVSGFAPDHDATDLLSQGALGFLEKPFTAAALTRAVRAALSSVPDAASGTDP